jgi:DEAD/DEAH box helicase domain-containing protein
MNELAMRAAQRADLNAHSTESLVDRLAEKYCDRITGYFRLPATNAAYAPFPDELSMATRTALHSRGIVQLYSHQRAAWDASARGEHVVVVTPTASGKSLCYHLPVIEAVRAQRAKALYLFPTKALAQDQVAELLELNKAGELGVRAYTFDGDTPNDARQAIRTHGDIVVSNPDMLHQAILQVRAFFDPAACRCRIADDRATNQAAESAATTSVKAGGIEANDAVGQR